jgi:hypothetical protein
VDSLLSWVSDPIVFSGRSYRRGSAGCFCLQRTARIVDRQRLKDEQSSIPNATPRLRQSSKRIALRWAGIIAVHHCNNPILTLCPLSPECGAEGIKTSMFRRRLRLFQASGLIALRSSRGRLRRWRPITTRRESSFWAVKKTQFDWVKAIITFSLKLIPGWFDFVEKLLVLGALKYLEDTRNNWFVTTVYLASLMVFYLYLQALLYNFPFDRFLPHELTKKSANCVSIFAYRRGTSTLHNQSGTKFRTSCICY